MAAKRRTAPEAPADARAIRAAAITLLARRDYLAAELEAQLLERGYESAAVAAVLAELREERLLDDARVVERYVAFRSGRGQGPVRIAADLAALGASRELIDAALASGPDWRSLAREVRQRRFGSAPPGTWAEKARQARFLQYRGFSSDHIRAATDADFDPD